MRITGLTVAKAVLFGACVVVSQLGSAAESTRDNALDTLAMGTVAASVGTVSSAAIIGSGQHTKAIIGSGQHASAIIGSGQHASAIIGSGQHASAIIGSGQHASAIIGSGYASR